MSDSDSDTGVPLHEPLSPSTTPETGHLTKPTTSTKRKRAAASEEPEVDDQGIGSDDSDAEAPKPQLSKRAAKKAKQAAKGKSKTQEARDEALDEELHVNHALKHMDGQLLADHITQRLRRFEGEKLSAVEQSDLRVPVAGIKDTTNWSLERTAEHLPAFLEEYSKPRRGAGKHAKRKLSHAFVEKGAPHTLVIAGSGLRAADLTRALRGFQTSESFVAKLFAKHIKLKEAIESTKVTRMNIGVGTPQRVIDLLEAGALDVEKLERVVVDASFIDGKKRGILDMRETVGPLVRLLARGEFRERYESSEADKKIELVFF